MAKFWSMRVPSHRAGVALEGTGRLLLSHCPKVWAGEAGRILHQSMGVLLAVDARRIMQAFDIPVGGTLEVLEKTLEYRLYANINLQDRHLLAVFVSPRMIGVLEMASQVMVPMMGMERKMSQKGLFMILTCEGLALCF